MQCLMIHNVHRQLLELDLSCFHLSFDDGLYSHYYYLPVLRQASCRPLLFFIVTGFIRPGKSRRRFDGRHLPNVKPAVYMDDAFIKGNFEHFMRLEEVQQLADTADVTIGAHSHFHEIILTADPLKKPLSPWKKRHLPSRCDELREQPLNRRSKLAYSGLLCEDGRLVARSQEQWLDYIKYDTEASLRWFERHLGLTPAAYSFPFNEQTPEFIEVLKEFGFTSFFGGSSEQTKGVLPRLDLEVLCREAGIR